MPVYLVRDKSQVFEVTMPGGRCTCSGRCMFCPHSLLIGGLLSGDKQVKNLVSSAMHKETRRGDLQRARMWFRWAVEIRGDKPVRDYLTTLILEDTRSFGLWDAQKAYASNVGGLLEALTLTRKRWELPAAKDCGWLFYSALVGAVTSCRITEAEIVAPAESKLLYYEWARLVLRVYLIWRSAPRNRWARIDNKEDSSAFFALLDRLKACLYTALDKAGLDRVSRIMQEAVKVGEEMPWIPLMAGVEALCGLQDPESDDQVQFQPYEDVVDAMVFPDYVLDGHTRQGKLLMRKVDDAGWEANKPLPVGVDPRWSGHPLGVWWRYNAYKQFGIEFRSVNWEAPAVDLDEWDTAVAADRFWRKSSALSKMWSAPAKRVAE